MQHKSVQVRYIYMHTYVHNKQASSMHKAHASFAQCIYIQCTVPDCILHKEIQSTADTYNINMRQPLYSL